MAQEDAVLNRQVLMSKVVVFLSFIFSVSALGENVPTLTDEKLDAYSKEATTKTQSLLRDPKQRQSSIEKGDGKKADDYVSNLTGNNSKNSESIYDLAADVLPLLVNKANGDPAKMKEIVEEYSKNPEAFANGWSPEQRAKLHELSLKLPTIINKN